MSKNHIPWTHRPWAKDIPEDQIPSGPHTVEKVTKVERDAKGDFLVTNDWGGTLWVEAKEGLSEPQVGDTLYAFGVANYCTTVAIGDVLYRAQSMPRLWVAAKRNLEEIEARMAEAGAKAEASMGDVRGKYTLKDPEGFAKGQAKNTDPYGACIYRYAERWMALMEERFNARGNAAVTIEDFLKEHASKLSQEADVEGISGFMYGAAANIIAHTWTYGESFRRRYNLDTQIGNEGEKANESGGTLNPALLNIR